MEHNKRNKHEKRTLSDKRNQRQDRYQSEKNKQPAKEASTYWKTAAMWLYSDPGPRRAIPVLALLTSALLIPFSGKAFHMDDTLFLKAAHQIITYPFNPYGFTVNWYMLGKPMAEVMKNPPLASYYIAAVASLFGLSEVALHLAFLPFAIAVIIGIYTLARHIGAPPVFAALAFLTSPLFLVSSTNIMCDTMMLALFVWGIALWVDGVKGNSNLRLVSAAFLVTLAALTKYFALSALPLMLVYALMRYRRFTSSLLILALPIGVLVGYQFWTATLYGHGLLSAAAEYAKLKHWTGGSVILGKFIIGLGFVGPVLPCIFLLAPRLLRPYLIVVAALLAFDFALLAIWGVVPTGSPPVSEGYRPLLTVELSVLITMGLIILTTTVMSWRSLTDPIVMLLCLWVIGTFIFGGFINWTINVRSLLPLGPPAAILIASRLTAHGIPSIKLTAASLIFATLLSLAVCWGDYRLAGAGREVSARVLSLPRSEGKMIWFQGHWGFQHYMEAGGAKALDVNVYPGDLIVIPNNNTNTYPINPNIVAPVGYIELPASRWVTTNYSGAGFYAHIIGPLPFAFESVPLERYDVFECHNTKAIPSRVLSVLKKNYRRLN